MPTVLEVCGRWSHMWQKSETAVMNKHTIASENSTPQSQLGVESGWIVCKFKHCKLQICSNIHTSDMLTPTYHKLFSSLPQAILCVESD